MQSDQGMTPRLPLRREGLLEATNSTETFAKMTMTGAPSDARDGDTKPMHRKLLESFYGYGAATTVVAVGLLAVWLIR